MKDSQFIFSRTREAIKERLSRIEEGLQQNTLKMRELGHDGDMMDDPLLFAFNDERIALDIEKFTLQQYLYECPDDIQSPLSLETITVGHSVRIDIKYSDGGHDQLCITIGGTLDQKYLGKNPLERDPSQIIVSTDTPLAKALLGKKEGEKLTYESQGGMGELVILGVEESPLLK